MADPTLLDVLQAGRAEWNHHRRTHPRQRDLSRADLGHWDLRGFNLSELNMEHAYLLGATLSHASLREARLSGANLIGTDLDGTDLRKADLSFATIAHCNLAAARTAGADFNGVNTQSQFATFNPEGITGEAPAVATAEPDHLRQLFRGVNAWNEWRLKNPDVRFPDLLDATLNGARFPGVNFAGVLLPGARLMHADLSDANLYKAELEGADLLGADLRRADLRYASMCAVNLSFADLTGADLSGASMSSVDLTRATLCDARLAGADLSEARITGTNIEGAVLTGCAIYGVAVWDVQGVPLDQTGLVLNGGLARPPRLPGQGDAAITVDDLEVAQFVYLILNNAKLRNVIETIGNRGVLILGRFRERMHVLDALRAGLRQRGYLPIVFDFEKPATRDLTETVTVLAGLSLFIIADITAPRSVPLELQATVPNFMIPFIPLLEEGEPAFAMFQDLIGKHDWVLDLLEYDSVAHLVAGLDAAVIRPALSKHEELLARKTRELGRRHIADYLPPS